MPRFECAWFRFAPAIHIAGLLLGATRLSRGQALGWETQNQSLSTAPGPLRAAQPIPSRVWGVPLQPAVYAVPALNEAALRHEDAAQAALGGTAALRAGLTEPALVVFDETDAGNWMTLSNAARLWSVGVRAPDAHGLRLHFSELALSPGVELWVYSSKAPEYPQGPLCGRGPFGDGDYWSTVFAGDTVVVEVYVPPGLAQAGTLVIDDVLNLYRDPTNPAADEENSPREGPCHCDVMCEPAFQPLHNATGRVLFVEQGVGLFCSGALLNTLANDQTPIFLTASHCCANQAAARTAVVWWFYQTLSCNGAVPQLANVPSSADADFLAGADIYTGSDYALIQIRGALPSGLTWAGWDASGALPDGTAVADIHHPTGAYKRIVHGETIPYPFGEFYNPSNYWGVGWTYCGTVELGTSGSPLYRADTQQLVGQMSHTSGPIGCENLFGPTGFGRLSAYYASIQTFLQAGSDDALEGAGNGTCATATPLSPGSYGDLVVKRTNEDWYRIDMLGCDTLTVAASFNNDYGNIDLGLYDACGGNLLASATTTGDAETVNAVAGGGARSVYLRVYLSYGVRNTYTLTVTRTGSCAGDLDCSGAVDLTDLSITLANYGSTNATPAQGDQTGDHKVDLADLAVMLAEYGAACL